MKRYLLPMLVGIALMLQIVMPSYQGLWGVPAAEAYTISSSSDVQASVSPSQAYPDGNQSITVTYNINVKFDGDWWVQVNNKSDPDYLNSTYSDGPSQPISTLLKKDLMSEEVNGNTISGDLDNTALSWMNPMNANNPIPLGDYEFRFYGPMGGPTSPVTYSTEQNSFFTAAGFSVVAPGNVQLTCPASAAPSDQVTVNWQGSITDPNAWVGLFTKDAADTVSAIDMGKAYGVSSWTIESSSPGTYNFRMFQYGIECGTSNDLVVAYPSSPTYNPTITEQPTQANPGDTITIAWSGAPPAVPANGGYSDEYDLCLYKYWYGGTGNDQFEGTIKSNIDTQGTYQYMLPASLTAGKYDVKIKGMYAGELWTSDYFTVGTPSTTLPGTTSTLQLTATPGNMSVTLKWTAPFYGKTVTGYYPYRGTSGWRVFRPAHRLSGNRQLLHRPECPKRHYLLLFPQAGIQRLLAGRGVQRGIGHSQHRCHYQLHDRDRNHRLAGWQFHNDGQRVLPGHRCPSGAQPQIQPRLPADPGVDRSDGRKRGLGRGEPAGDHYPGRYHDRAHGQQQQCHRQRQQRHHGCGSLYFKQRPHHAALALHYGEPGLQGQLGWSQPERDHQFHAQRRQHRWGTLPGNLGGGTGVSTIQPTLPGLLHLTLL